MSYNFFKTPVEYVKGVGPKRASLLNKELEVFYYKDLLSYYPFKYIDRSKFHKVTDIINDNAYIQLKGNIINVEIIGKGRGERMRANFKDDTGSIELVWFKGFKWIKDKFKPNIEYIIFGKPTRFNNSFNISHPEVDPTSETETTVKSNLQAFYNTSEKLKNNGLGSKNIAKIMHNLIVSAQGSIYENLSKTIINKLHLISREEAITNIHCPTNQQTLDKAITRLKFEELFFIQLSLIKQKLVLLSKSNGHIFATVGDNFNNFYKNKLPFTLTNAQKKVIKEIRIDMNSGKQMNRLLQGDVGSGKTLVAILTSLIAIDNGFQTCIMAPTEILASQHYDTISKILDGLNISINILTGSTKVAKRREIHKNLENGNLKILIGTHALIEDKVKFQNLGYVIIDEQHRFGVAQRAKMWKKNVIPPHILVMTATPIPRTLAMTLYGDLDISVIDELPPGRKSILTYHYDDSKRLKLFGFIKEQIKKGNQIYIVYPLIKESEKLDLKDLIDGYESINRKFPLPEYAISIVHGKMKTKEKDYEMQRFVRGETNIMVATTVIEVGVDIPNASVMIIESAERFGLSQLHQLRGRVGRGVDQSFCILMSKEKLSSDASKRLETMVQTTDGFELAEVDLKLRGPGDIQGTQQSGILDLKIADIIKDEKMLHYARNMAIDLLNQDPNLENQENVPIKYHFQDNYKHIANWGKIS